MRNNTASETMPSATAARRRTDLLTRRGYVSLLLRLCVIALALWVIFSQVFLLIRCRGEGMFPALEDGDLVLAYRLEQEYAKGDVLVYTVDGQTYLGRVAALEGDVVMMDDSGALTVNGAAQSGQILYPTYAKEGVIYPYTVTPGTLFLLGDYRTRTQDSRDFGAVAVEAVEGKVITVLRGRGI